MAFKRINLIKPFCDCIIHLSFDRKEYNNKITKMTSEPTVLAQDDEMGKATCIKNNNDFAPFFIVGIFSDNIEIVTHEASHITTHIMQYLNINDDEFRSYMVGYITKEICNRLTKVDNGI